MLDKEEARQIALEIIGHLSKTSGNTYVIMENGIIEKPMAWVVNYNSAEYNASRNLRHMVFGITPLMVNRRTGESHLIPPMLRGESLDLYLAEVGAGPDEPNAL
ncbi:MAG TPA: hypothetical protein VF630_04250 [Hymenobacter sp.]|jgi:hypothetical protein